MYSESNLFFIVFIRWNCYTESDKSNHKGGSYEKEKIFVRRSALTAALAATGCGGTNGSPAADNAKTQADTGKDSGSQDSGNKDSGVKDTSKADEADRNISCTLTLATWDVAAAKTFEELDNGRTVPAALSKCGN